MNIVREIVHELKLEANAILNMAKNLDREDVNFAFKLLQECEGKVVLTGIGKAGIVARKISATLASTGTASIFVHAGEGNHGDLGMIQPTDVVIAISNSGNTQELLSIIPYIRFIGVPLIVFTGNLGSPLADAADALLDCSVPEGSEPLGMVPTASTTAALALGDAFAVVLLKKRGFSMEDFARFHPGGTIGKKLLLKVADLMHRGPELPIVHEDTPMSDVIVEMTSKKLGCAAVADANAKLAGMITDGDLRRAIQSHGANIMTMAATDCMTPGPKRLKPNELAVNALALMEKYQITMLPVVDDEDAPIGMLHMHDLIRAGVV
jgi:arabinose-5-phosphate isomerase